MSGKFPKWFITLGMASAILNPSNYPWVWSGKGDASSFEMTDPAEFESLDFERVKKKIKSNSIQNLIDYGDVLRSDESSFRYLLDTDISKGNSSAVDKHAFNFQDILAWIKDFPSNIDVNQADQLRQYFVSKEGIALQESLEQVQQALYEEIYRLNHLEEFNEALALARAELEKKGLKISR